MATQPMLSYEIHGADLIIRKLAKLKVPIRPMVKRIILHGRNSARKASKPHPLDTGRLQPNGVINSRVAAGEIPPEARIFANFPAAARIDQGRSPGNRPALKLMRLWAIRHGIPKDRAFALAKSIEDRGSEGVHFMQTAAERIAELLPEELAKATREMEQAFERERAA